MKNYKRVIKFVMPMLMTVLLCVASPALTEIATASLTIAQSATAIDEQARSSYQNQKFDQAVSLFEQAAKNYGTAGDPIGQALSLSNLSLARQQLGQWSEAKDAIAQSLSILEKTPENTAGRSNSLAQVLDIQGGLLLAQGQPEPALRTWERSAKIYRAEGKPARLLISQTNQAQALQNMGLHRRAIALLTDALKLQTEPIASETDRLAKLRAYLKSVPASPETATALWTLGDSVRAIGNFAQARALLERSLEISTGLKSDTATLALMSLGNTARAQTDAPAALKYYQQAASNSNGVLRSQAQVNQLSLLVDRKDPTAQTLLPQVQQQLEALPPSRSAIESRINLAQTMMRLNGTALPTARFLAATVEQSRSLGDPRLESYAIGTLGNLYEETRQWSQAETLTQQALQLAQQNNAGDIAYRWYWQLGRVLRAQNKTDSAIAAYKQAVSTIKSLRADLAAASADVQFSFRVAIEPIHRELVALLLKSEQPDKLKTARSTIEDLQLVELDNFFREACLNANPTQIDQVDRRAAVLYPILLEDQLAIIASLPKSDPKATDTNLRYYRTNVTRAQVEALALRARSRLAQQNGLLLSRPMLQQMYDWLIRPAAKELAASKAETLVFVLDGGLRSVPMGALYDGQKFLIEQYSVAVTPGLQLLSPTASTRSLQRTRIGALVAGLTEARSGFPALPQVKQEVNQIEAEIPSQVLFNQKFTSAAFRDRIATAPFPIVHLATHGKFSSSAEDTFILTWDGRLDVNQLNGVLQTAEVSRTNTLELLVLSACETAEGDPRSALGLAGVAVRSGARSTVATLWQVNDQSAADLITEFYSELAKIEQTKISKAEALRRAQLSILRNPKYDQQPAYWAAFVLIGNWT